MFDLIVIGGGISGLSAAHWAAARSAGVLVLEREARTGGCIQSQRADGFWYELGAHTCYNSYGGLLELIEQRGLLPRLLPRAKVPFRLLVDGRIRSVMSQLNILELALSAPRLLFAQKEGLSVRSYYGSLVGRQNYQRVFGPLFAAVPSQPADDFPADMLFKARRRRRDVLRSYTLEGGLSSITDELARGPRIEVRCNAAATAVFRQATGFAVALADSTQVSAPRVLIAVPPPVAAELLAPVLPPVAADLRRLKSRTVKTLGVMAPRGSVAAPPFAGIIPLDGSFFSCVSRDAVPDANWRGFAIHQAPDTSREAGLRVLAEVLGISTSAFSQVTEREVILPSPVVGHRDTVRQIDANLTGISIGLSGNYFAGLSIEDCVQRSKSEVARLFPS